MEEKTILCLKGPGGGMAIVGKRKDTRWQFRGNGVTDHFLYYEEREADETVRPTKSALDEHSVKWFDSLSETLESKNRCWNLLDPAFVDHEFRAELLALKCALDERDAAEREWLNARWLEHCDVR